MSQMKNFRMDEQKLLKEVLVKSDKKKKKSKITWKMILEGIFKK